MSEIENGRLGLYDNEHWKSNHLVTLGFKGLMNITQVAFNLVSIIVFYIVQCSQTAVRLIVNNLRTYLLSITVSERINVM